MGKESALRKPVYVRANEDITIDIYEGETFGLVGESGCGKSTFGRVLLQLYPQTAGSSMYYGRTLDELAPKYVTYTLKNARKMVEKYHQAKKKAEEVEEHVKSLGENITYAQSSARDQAVFEAENALNNAAKILGGFMVCPDIEKPAKALFQLQDVRVELAKVRKQQGLAKQKSATQAAQFDGRIAELEVKCSQLAAVVEQEKEKYRHIPEFDYYEAMLDDGVDLSRLTYDEIRQLRQDLQIVFQDPYSSLNPRLTVGQIIEEGLVTHHMFRKGSEEAKQYILETMRKCGLQDYMLHRYPHQFSGGQRQRICIARALAVNPKFVVCDECVSALDVSIQSQIINLLQDLKEQQGLTYLFISHDLSVVKHISDRIGVMYLGNMVELSDKDTIFNDPRHPYTVALLSSIPTTDPDSVYKDRIILEGNIPSPIKPPTGCKFHTRCYMATEKCSRITPQLEEIAPGHFCACHYPERKIGENGEYLIKTNGSLQASEGGENGGEEA